jgi:glutamate dehydrogenase
VLNRLGVLIHLTIHPVIAVQRDAHGVIEAIESPEAKARKANGEAAFESYMHFEIDQLSDPERLEEIRAQLQQALSDVRAAVEDWRKMLGQIEPALADLKRGATVIDAEELAEVEAFLSWIADHNFTFLGYTCYDLVRDKDGDQLSRVEGSGMGLLRPSEDPEAGPISRSFAALPPRVRRLARLPVPLIITKANSRSTVHRPVYLDYIGVRRFDEKGKVLGEHRFLGLFTSAAYHRNPRHIPLLRRKVDRLIERANLRASGHSGKALANIVESYPRDELFQIDDDELFDTVNEILHLKERQRIRKFVRRDTFERFVSYLIYVPRERYHTVLRYKNQDVLLRAYGAT